MINSKEVQDVESTVLYHISQAAELNHQHVRDYIKYFKSVLHAPEIILEPFVLSVLLTVASIDENQVIINNCLFIINLIYFSAYILIQW